MLVDPGAVKLRVKGTTYYVPKYEGPRRWLGNAFACEHDRSPNHCRDCGTGLCPCGEQFKSNCRKCFPELVCDEHGRLKRTCKECKGASICECDKIRSKCGVHGGGGLCPCEKPKPRYACPIHGSGKGFCVCGSHKYNCKKCDGNAFCKDEQHSGYGERKYVCVECGGAGLCPCNKKKSDCREHGGSAFCPHDRRWSVCRECLGAEKAVTMSTNCNKCAQVLSGNRLERNGGNGFCEKCEARRNAEAAANGSEPLPKGQSWETLCFTKLLPLVKHADGLPFSPDQLDQRAAGGLGTSKAVKRKRECDTTTVRYPDSLWVRYSADAAVPILVVVVEIDEHSHSGSYTSECESGKIDDTFEALQTLFDKRMVPIVFVKMNPNNYDKKLVRLDERIAVTATLVNSYLQKSEEEIKLFLQTHAPIVHVLYYHSKEGAQHLAHFAAKAPAAGWAYHVS